MGRVFQFEIESLETIKAIIIEAGGSTGNPVYLEGVSYYETHRSSTGSGNFTINCLFINEEEEVCADLYWSSSAGFFDFICGKRISDLGERGLREILYALENDLWSMKECGYKAEKENKGFFRLPLRLPSIFKGI